MIRAGLLHTRLGEVRRRSGQSRPPAFYPRFLLLLCLLVLAGCSPVGAHLDASQAHIVHWQGRVDVTEDLIFDAGTTLVLAPGTEVVFHPVLPENDRFSRHPNFPGAELIVRGRLLAHGTFEAPIVFRAADPAAAAGSWGGINIERSPRAEFDYCVFQSANSALHARESTVFVEHSLFRRNLVGVRFHSSDILIENNLFAENGSAIRFHFGAPVICHNRFVANRRSIFITAHPRDLRIENNNFISAVDYHLVLGEEVPEDVDATRNWWGGDTGEIAPLIYDRRREGHLGQVLLAPLLKQPAQEDIPWNR